MQQMKNHKIFLQENFPTKRVEFKVINFIQIEFSFESCIREKIISIYFIMEMQKEIREESPNIKILTQDNIFEIEKKL
jgi:hypothetical protein